MARVFRLSGALIVETSIHNEPAYFMVGDTKVPCEWAPAGFERPADRDLKLVPWVRLVPIATPKLSGIALQIASEGEAAATLVAERLLVARTGAVSERLFRLIVGEDAPPGEVDARWLSEMPMRVWDVVRDAVLKCS